MAAVTTLTKQPSESRLYDFDFTNILRTGDTITSVESVSVDVAGLTTGGVVVNSEGTKVQVRLSSGTHNVKYKITVLVNTAQTDILELDGILHVYQY